MSIIRGLSPAEIKLMALDTHMNNGTGTNCVIALIAFLSSFSVGSILASLLVAICVGLLGKAVDGVIKLGINAYTNRWKRQCLQAEARAEAAERRLRELQGKQDAV